MFPRHYPGLGLRLAYRVGWLVSDALRRRGRQSHIPWLAKKILRLAISTCLLYGFWMLLNWAPLWSLLRPFGMSRNRTGFWLILTAILFWMIGLVRILFSRPKAQATPGPHSPTTPAFQEPPRSVPEVRFADVGGLETEKQLIRELVESRLEFNRYRKYGITRNGILLHGPRGSGKSFLAEATAGEFTLSFLRVPASELFLAWIGETERNIRAMFAEAAAQVPVLLFIDELDALGATRQAISVGSDPGGAGRSFNSAATQLMDSIARYREVPQFVIMAATNHLDALDQALIREGRFDLKIRLDLPDEPTRLRILETLFKRKPWERFDLREFARGTPGASAAKLRALVDRAASFAATEGRWIEERDMRRALDEAGGKDRPLFQPVYWHELVLEEHTEQDLRMLIRLLGEPALAKQMKIEAPTGVLLIGPPGTGKTMISRLIATVTGRSFYPITAADVLGGLAGDSVKRVAQIFSRAKQENPSVILIDEMDGLLPRAARQMSHHDVQVVEQFLIEISDLLPEHNVFLVGTTNDSDAIDPRALRGGRFSEKIRIHVPGIADRERLLRKYLDGAPLEPGFGISQIAGRLEGMAPADIEAVCQAAKRFAFVRVGEGRSFPSLTLKDFEAGIKRVCV
ncbi:MAG: AAA family ATPase [Acidobacteria bacterium]|nr:AAA family ATPase [Acidobacteriota bacterium]MCI0717733.1 AAA family ATPase [Acidobacteriota bacterium]